MNEIIGLPAIVSARYRIVIDKSLRHMFNILKDSTVQVFIGKNQIQIFPSSPEIPGSMQKSISAGRFNLPIEWAHKNQVQIGSHVFLIATNDCVLVRPSG